MGSESVISAGLGFTEGSLIIIGTITISIVLGNPTIRGLMLSIGSQLLSRVAAAGIQQGVERILNRYAKFYTPAALLLGAGVWWWSGDLLRAITILIVFCPCVMVLAVPFRLADHCRPSKDRNSQ